ncbi:Chromosome (plasmid) partitioning protein ParA [Clostridiaceae bacterium JG1575]|nr:Chromosome (plasmid) partitioning protein ParA [Clostridiaceae bacterium JG1575]
MKVISLFNQKGGVGKTTTNINLAAGLASRGKKVLTIDMDPQGNTTSGLGLDKRTLKGSTYDLLLGDVTVQDLAVSIDAVPGLWLVPADMNLAGADIELSQSTGWEKVLVQKLQKLPKTAYDFVFLDCPPSLGVLSINALAASDSVIIPMQSEFYALEGISQLIDTIQRVKKGLNESLEVEGVLLSMYDPRKNLHLEVAKEVKDHFGDLVYECAVPVNVRLAEAPSFGEPIHLYDPRCKGAEAFRDLVEEFLKRNEEPS